MLLLCRVLVLLRVKLLVRSVAKQACVHMEWYSRL